MVKSGEAGVIPALSRNCEVVGHVSNVTYPSQVARLGRFTTLSWKGGGGRLIQRPSISPVIDRGFLFNKFLDWRKSCYVSF